MPIFLKAPFSYTGSKFPAANTIWQRLGDVTIYIEPFAGSAAVLLNRPSSHRRCNETINDADGFITNFFRSMKYDPRSVADHFQWPVNVHEVKARNKWLIERAEELTEFLQADPDFFDAKVAGRWAYGMAVCFQKDWVRTNKFGRILTPHVRIGKSRVSLELPPEYLAAMQQRLSRVRILNHDWRAVLKRHVLGGTAGVLLDPPYTARTGRKADAYRIDSLTVGDAVHAWAVEHGNDPKLRIALCGYDGEYKFPKGWKPFAWNHPQAWAKNRGRERIWFSPHCLPVARRAASA